MSPRQVRVSQERSKQRLPHLELESCTESPEDYTLMSHSATWFPVEDFRNRCWMLFIEADNLLSR